ncbi:MAG TPA: hypothetical protein VLJ11_04685 [Bryobacteraceae bacterium]|nr:hypothetical protein [Bryobacteraceae bacterium]
MRLKLTLALLAIVTSAFAADMNGSWALSVDTPNGKFESTADLKQDGEKISGTVHNQFGDSPVTGAIKDNDVTLIQKADFNGQSVTITYTGKVDDKKITGKFKFGDQGEGDFTAEKK